MKKLNKINYIILLSFFFTVSINAQQTKNNRLSNSNIKAGYVLYPFDYGEIVIENSEVLNNINAEKEYYLSIPNDALLKGFRQRAGLDAPGIELGGWYKHDVFHVFGQLLAGYSRFYAATGDERCLVKAIYLLEEWEKTIDPDGYFFYTNNPNAKHYIYEKMMGGLVDCYIYCNSELAKTCMSRITDWAIANLDRNKEFGQHIDQFNGEWYTLSENLYRAYMVTGDTKYKDFAEIWEYTEFWEIIRENGNPFIRKDYFHAYSHLNTFSSAAAAYQVKNDSKYLESCIAAYDFFREKQCFLTGGFGPSEMLKHTSELTSVFKGTDHSFEVQCGTWACFKLNKQLISATGNARFGDWMELLLINGIGANIPMDSEGNTYYYANYHPKGAVKTNLPLQWACCSGTRPQAFADIQNIVWFHNNNDLFLNLFVPSSLHWKNLKITQQTDFPKISKTTVYFEGSNSENFIFGFRKPEWMKSSATVKVNGEVTELIENNGWLTMNRVWNGGDIIEIDLPMSFEVCKMLKEKDYPAALKYGPVTMAVQQTDEYPTDLLENEKIPVEDQPLTFKVTGHESWTVRPYYSIEENDQYYLYLDPSVGYTVQESNIKREGNGGIWLYYDLWHINRPGAYVEVTFTGIGIQWNCFKFDDAGIVAVTIDGEHVETVDLYDPQRGLPFSWSKKNLPYGEHRLRLTLLEEKNPNSSGRYINYTNFVVYTINPDPDETIYASVPSKSITESGGVWFGGWDMRASSSFGATVKVKFYGTGIRWNGKRYADGCEVTIKVDGEDKGSFYIPDLADENDTKVHYDITGLPLGIHEVVLINSTANAYINYSEFSNLSVIIEQEGSWYVFETNHFSNGLGATVKISFHGTGIKWYGAKYSDAGITSFSIDYLNPEDVNVYAPQWGLNTTWEKTGLTNGKHTLICHITGRKHPSSTNYYFNYITFEPQYDGNIGFNSFPEKEDKIALIDNYLIFPNSFIGRKLTILEYNIAGLLYSSKNITVESHKIYLEEANEIRIITVNDSTGQQLFSKKIIN